MNNEYLDIVDGNNEKTGKRELRSLVHSTGLLHRTVHVYVFKRVNSTIYFLVHLRAKNKDLNPNKWDTRFGGHIKSGEDVASAVVNEIKEEIGLDIDKNELTEGSWVRGGRYPNCEFVKIFYLEYTRNLKNLKFNDGEVQKVKWFQAADIIKELGTNPEDWSASKDGFEKAYSEVPPGGGKA
jgi:isopentenyldiphosphate isomerase